MKFFYLIPSVLSCVGLFADTTSPQKKDQLLSKNISPSYNFPASVALQRGTNLSLTASYLYWDTQEGGLDLATTTAYNSGTNTIIPSTHGDKAIFQNSEYKSGFKVGMGYVVHDDDWVLRADYTRLHQSTKTSRSAPEHPDEVGALYVTSWFYQISTASQGLAGTHLSSRWHLGLDWLDVVLERPFYSGRKLTLTPFMGLRASWIKQSLNIKMEETLNIIPTTSSVKSRNHLRSWGLGPRVGMEGHFLLGAGFRLQGEIGGSLLFTQFSKVSHSEDPFVTGGSEVSYAFHNYNTVRPMAEANLGLGWGRYFSQQRFHFDLSATYDFNYLWGQNMLRVLNDMNLIGTNAAANDLTFQGLTITAAFNF